MSELERHIKENLNEEGKLPCKDAYKVAAKTKEAVRTVGDTAKAMGVRISDCGLGQFGGLKGDGEYDEEAKARLEPLLDENKKVFCKEARDAAAGIGLKKIRGTLDKCGIDVKYCELGCFTEKKRQRLYIKTKTWIENEKGELLFGKGKTEVLEDVARTGSIAGAAEKLGMNYKKTWSHIQILQKSFSSPLVATQKGGGESGGTTLTPEAYELMEAYKTLQADIEAYANERFKDLFLKPRNKRDFS
ncbi:MAG: LysR family transcriptional regulator [Campylobacterales bacterium]|nr:LysR family transcriptional regulator [Campylobacterales bacterium]